ncbi:MAG: amidohydrolase family protein [Dehalococcoidia bacterium]
MIIDVHHHWVPREFVDNVEKYLRPNERAVWKDGVATIFRDNVEVCTRNPKHCDIEAQIRDMDAAQVDMAVLTTAVWQGWNNMKMAPFINDSMAEIMAKYPHRFLALAHVPPFEEGAVEELERAIKVLGLKGVCITTHFDGKYPGDDAYRPLYKKIAELDVPIFVHAASAMVGHEFLSQDEVTHKMVRTFGRAIDHCLVVIRLLGSDILKDFPTLKFINGHIGGVWAYMSTRLLKPFRRDWNTDEAPSEGLDRLYFDLAPSGWQQPQITCATALLGADHLLFGSDFPSADPKALEVNQKFVTGLDIPAQDKEKIFSGNAIRLFKLKV